ncbi:MAG: Clp protease ClpP [Bacteroidales bacterium]|nr:Clp protease ClpP [Bacteroidales bacterium]
MALLKIYTDIENENNAVGFFGDRMDVFSASRLTDFLQASDDSEIDGRLHCRGGSVTEGYTCHDLLTHSGKKVSMTVEGLCASIATVILMSAPKDRRKIYPYGQVMIHNPYIPEYTLADSYGAEDLAKMAADLKAEENRLLDFYVANTGADREQLKLMMDAETTLNAQQALEMGFVGEILPAISNSKKDFNNKFKQQMEAKQIDELKAEMAKKDTILKRLLKAVGLGVEAVNLSLTDVTGNTLTVERETGDPAVGDTASPDGVFTMEDGKVITVAGGLITEIAEPHPRRMQMDKGKLKTWKAEIETLKGANTQAAADLAVQLAEAKKVTEDAKAEYVELQGLKSKYFPEGRQQDFNEPPVSKVQERINQRKAEIEAKKTKK